MDDDTLMHLVISLSVGAFFGFIVHLMFGDDEKPKRRK